MGEPSDDYEYTTANPEAQMALACAINEILFMERMKRLMPLVAKELVKAGVDFSKVDYSKVSL